MQNSRKNERMTIGLGNPPMPISNAQASNYSQKDQISAYIQLAAGTLLRERARGTLKGHSDWVRWMAFSPDGKLVESKARSQGSAFVLFLPQNSQISASIFAGNSSDNPLNTPLSPAYRRFYPEDTRMIGILSARRRRVASVFSRLVHCLLSNCIQIFEGIPYSGGWPDLPPVPRVDPSHLDISTGEVQSGGEGCAGH
jgi:hypothetical protein